MKTNRIYHSVPPVIQVIDHDRDGNERPVRYIREDKMELLLNSIHNQLNAIRETFDSPIEVDENET